MFGCDTWSQPNEFYSGIPEIFKTQGVIILDQSNCVQIELIVEKIPG